ncbi:MAG: ornithine cyclodeaminase family protein [Alphaproteobacteria bacterium]|nr:ornithine cyclodeaminase family protein [Alphaproteobacteria bacterium]
MRIVSAAEVEAATPYPDLIESLRAMFRQGCAMPVRHHHPVKVPGASDAMLLLMPAWQDGQAIGVKLVTVFPDNAQRDLPAIQGVYLLLDGRTGVPRALLDGPMLTKRRTAAASALAADYLARRDAARLLVIGTGALAPELVAAHAAIRPIREVRIWGRTPAKAAALAARVAAGGLAAAATTALEESTAWADVVSCATLSREPLVLGARLRPGVHVDLVGAFTPDMRESDDEAARRAQVFVDTRAGATREAGDIVQPLRSGILTEAKIRGDLYELCRGERRGREDDKAVTLFKSVGAALEDLAAALLVVDRLPA